MTREAWIIDYMQRENGEWKPEYVRNIYRLVTQNSLNLPSLKISQND